MSTYVVIEGTLRQQDLITVFLDELKTRDPDEHARFLDTPALQIPARALVDQGDDWWDSEGAMWLLGDLALALDNSAEEGTYFGCVEGDGACFGFFAVEQD